MRKSQEAYSASRTGRPQSNNGNGGRFWNTNNPKNISHLGTVDQTSRLDRHKKNVLSQGKEGKQSNMSSAYQRDRDRQRSRNAPPKIYQTHDQRSQGNFDESQYNEKVQMDNAEFSILDQQSSLPVISQRFAYQSPIHKVRSKGRESNLSADKSQLAFYDQQNNDKLKELIQKYQQKPKPANQQSQAIDKKFLPSMMVSNGRQSGTGLAPKKLNSHQKQHLLSTSNYNLINTAATDDNMSMSNAYQGADIHRLNKTKQQQTMQQEKQRQFKKQQSRVEQFIDTSPYSKQMTIEKNRTITLSGDMSTITPSNAKNRGPTFSNKNVGSLMRRKTLLQSNNNNNQPSSVPKAINKTNITHLSNLASSQTNSREGLSSDGVDVKGAQNIYEAEKNAKYQRDVAEIVENCHKKYSKEFTKPKKKAKRLQSNDRQLSIERYGMYTMPTHQMMLQNFKQTEQARKQRLLSEVSKNANCPEGMLAVSEVKSKNRFRSTARKNGYQDYVNHFSHVADVFSVENRSGKFNPAFEFGQAIMARVQNNLKQLSDQEAVAKMMNDTDQRRMQFSMHQKSQYGSIPLSLLEKAVIRPSIYHGEEQDKRTLQKVADTFSNNVVYQQRMKQRDMEEDFKQVKSPKQEIDPRIKYMKRCLQNLNMTLPILDKIYAKTLCLQDYHLSDGNCQGLAEACEFLDSKIVNRMLFNNCGISGDQLAVILEGAAKMKDFKALIYKMNLISSLAIEKLIPVIQKPIPNHLEELSIIDCKMNATQVEQLMDGLIDNHARLKKLTLVNAHHTERSFEKIVEFISGSALLKELDLSWSGVRPSLMLKLLQAISVNRFLTQLSLSNNVLLEEQPTSLTAQQIIDGKTEVELTSFNLEVVTCFKDFIKYNIFLVHLNLEYCGLIGPAIKYIAALLRRSQALRCLHLCGNTGVNDEMVEWVKTRIHARVLDEQIQPRAHSAQLRYTNSMVKGSPMKRGLMKVNRGASIEFQDQFSKTKEWQDIRAGIKLRNIVQSQRMHEVTHLIPGSDSGKMIIQRQLGHKELMPGSAQWGVYNGLKDECWICNHSTMTIFVWTPRIGLQSCAKEPQIIAHYQAEVDKMRDRWVTKPGHFDGAPYIFGPMTDWQPKRMKLAVEYCIDNDPKGPDFIDEGIKMGKIRAYCKGTDKEPMNEEESKSVILNRDKYYEENWHRALQSIVRYKNPAVANSEAYTLLSLQSEHTNQPIFFHAEFCKPGKNIYLVEHMRKQSIKKGFFEMLAFGESGEDLLASPVADKKPDLFVHQMLTQLRQEDIPKYHNPRHVHRYQTDLVECKRVFTEWKEDSPEVLGQIFRHDWEAMLIKRIVTDEEQLRRIKNEIQNNLIMFKDIYVYLQSKSSSYPYLNDQVVNDLFINALNFGKGRRNHLTAASLHNIVLEVCVQGERAKGEAISRIKKICRAQLIEIMVRFAIYLYTTKVKDKNDDNEYNNLTPSQAFYIFIEQKVKPFFHSKQMSGQEFRDDDLWTHDIEIIYTLNEMNLRNLFAKYCQPRMHSLTEQDIEKMICDDSHLPVNRAMVREAYGMSQMTVINEQDAAQFANYNKSKYVEFIEVLARVAQLMFEGSEMEDEKLSWKLEHVLDILFGTLLHKKVTRNRIIVEEFSDSDDDY